MLRGILSSLFVILLGQSSTPSAADWQWLDQHRTEAFEAFMPIQDSTTTLVTYRGYREGYNQVEERYFCIRYAQGDSFDSNRLEATVVIPMGASIQKQILDLHIRQPRANLEALLRQVTVRRSRLDAEHCPAIRTRMDALSKTAISLPERDEITLDPFVHHISIVLGLAEIDAKLYDEENALVKWARDTLTALMACGSGK